MVEVARKKWDTVKEERLDMSDRENLLELFRSFDLTPGQDDGEVWLLAQNGGVEGYSNFYATFKFDSDGKFVSAGIWE